MVDPSKLSNEEIAALLGDNQAHGVRVGSPWLITKRGAPECWLIVEMDEADPSNVIVAIFDPAKFQHLAMAMLELTQRIANELN